MFKKTCLFALSLLAFSMLRAAVRLPRIFTDHMVIQRDKPVSVWGWADAGEQVVISFHNQQKQAKANSKGYWKVMLDPESAGGPFQLIVKGRRPSPGGNTLTVSDILVGEVWICSGQSNMEMPIEGWGRINNYRQEVAAADYPQIRHFKVPNTVSIEPKDDIAGGDWKVCSPETAGDFTATGFFFARELYRQLHVPVGLINTSWGGTMVETWISRGAFEQRAEFRDMIAAMPSAASMDAIAAQKKAALLKAVETLQGPLPAPEAAEQFKDPAYDDTHWAHIKLPGLWEQAGLGLENLDGVVWFRKTIIVSEEDAGKPAILELGKIDDSDDTYVNGTKVGSTKNQYNESRKYTIPAGVLKAGKNLIAVRVEDTGGGGGIYGEPGEMKCTIAGKEQSLTGDWSFLVTSIEINTKVGPNSAPTLLFNAMINPLIPFTIKGAIWYQGEANADRAFQYRKAFPLMISDWRARWGEGDFPFYFVQLSSWHANNGNSSQGSSWAELREAQAMTLSLPNTGMAVTTDIGDSADIHPKDKQDVGRRLSAIALDNLYGKAMEYSGPMYQSMTKDNNRVILTFAHTGSGLVAHDKYGYIKGFEIAGGDHQFHYAKASINGDKIIVWQDGVNDPVAVRYGWADYPGESNLFNKEGFPAAPFRTDQWPGRTDGVKYKVGL